MHILYSMIILYSTPFYRFLGGYRCTAQLSVIQTSISHELFVFMCEIDRILYPPFRIMISQLVLLQTLIILYLANSFTVAQSGNQIWPIGTSTSASMTHPTLIIPESVDRRFYGLYVMDGKLDTFCNVCLRVNPLAEIEISLPSTYVIIPVAPRSLSLA